MTVGIGQELERHIVPPLAKFITECTTDYIFSQLQSMDVQWSVSRDLGGKYHAVIYKDGMVRYQATGRGGKHEGPRAVLARCIARFFICEQKDYHELGN